ncbi:MAG: prolipoprotein diacylglyceryl transferase [Ferruginibacter sp.]|nr:prolipoprotein diacylglyceryl transferase [Ferruginibacter sp.]
MYPNLFYAFRDWFGVEIPALSFLNSFGLMVAVAFIVAAWVLNMELKRKEKAGLLHPREEWIEVGKPAGAGELFVNAAIGFLFGYKLIGLFFSMPEGLNSQEYIFSSHGSIWGGVIGAAVLCGLKWWDKHKAKLPSPEKRSVRIWPHDRVGDIVILSLVFGILGAKLFDAIEHWDDFIADPIATIFSASGLAFYGGLITATLFIFLYAHRKKIGLSHLVDAAAPALMIAYGIGRLGCQISGDGDWGILNSAYISDEQGNISKAAPGDFEKGLNKYATYYLQGKIIDVEGNEHYVTDRVYHSLQAVPHKSLAAPGFLPDKFFAYAYPVNVNNDGIDIPGNLDEYHRVLPLPVFPTPLYEFIVCTFLFGLMWLLRYKIKIPLMMFGLYLVLNGAERFLIERIRVNKLYDFLGFKSTQAEIIAVGLIMVGLILVFFSYLKSRKKQLV